MAGKVTVVAKIRAAKGKGDALAALLTEQVGVVRKAEPGCLAYRLRDASRERSMSACHRARCPKARMRWRIVTSTPMGRRRISRALSALFDAMGYTVRRKRPPSWGSDAFLDQERWLRDAPVRVVFDVGANDGDTVDGGSNPAPTTTISAPPVSASAPPTSVSESATSASAEQIPSTLDAVA